LKLPGEAFKTDIANSLALRISPAGGPAIRLWVITSLSGAGGTRVLLPEEY
jgi:hypothetical protein